jgi:3-deoxy-D-manno-octulosonic-acid transferase
MLRTLFLYFWSIIIMLAFSLLRLAGHLIPSLASFSAGRIIDKTLLQRLAAAAAGKKRRVLVLCSSAGEYEQALPLIAKLEQSADSLVVIVFFSPSGINFVKARGDSRNFVLAPMDSIWQWRRLFAAVRPTVSVVVRHELWPGFLGVAREVSSRVLLINVSKSSEKLPAYWQRYAKRWLYGFFDQIFFVSSADLHHYQQSYRLPEVQLAVSGDSKYDRVLVKSPRDRALAQEFSSYLDCATGSLPRLIVGSAWPQDWLLVMKGLVRVREESNFAVCCIIAPHEPTEAHLQELEEACAAHGFRSRRLSTLADQLHGKVPCRALACDEIILVDSLGVLSALYGACHGALVGGAMHHKIHNVLEPASYGLAIAHGPFYRNSVEAIALVEAGLARVVNNSEEFARWCAQMQVGTLPQGAQVRAFLEARRGAVDTLFAAIEGEAEVLCKKSS